MGEWLLSRRGQHDSSQARKCLGSDTENSRPGGTVESSKPKYSCRKGKLASNLSRDPFNRPAGAG